MTLDAVLVAWVQDAEKVGEFITTASERVQYPPVEMGQAEIRKFLAIIAHRDAQLAAVRKLADDIERKYVMPPCDELDNAVLQTQQKIVVLIREALRES